MFGGSFVPSTELTCTTVTFDGEQVWVLGVRRSVAGGFDVVGPSACIARMVERLLRTARGHLTPAGAEALDTVRMEAGIASFQRDFDADTVLQEIDQPDIVSFHKGCYLGQEIVARIHFQGQPSKLLRRLVVSADDVPSVGDELFAAADDKPAGRVTSVAISPSLGPVVFAMVKRKYYAPGTTVRVARNGGFAVATVAERNPAPGIEKAE
jgi:folate-binding protein YgfZ